MWLLICDVRSFTLNNYFQNIDKVLPDIYFSHPMKKPNFPSSNLLSNSLFSTPKILYANGYLKYWGSKSYFTPTVFPDFLYFKFIYTT